MWGGGQNFVLILVLKKHAVHNAITSRNKSLMQLIIVLGNWRYKVRIAFSGAFL